MILSPRDPATIHLLARLGLGNLSLREPTVEALNPHRRAFEGRGFYGPFQVKPGDGVIRDRAEQPMFMALQVLDRDLQHAMAVDNCIALNRLCGFEAADTDTGSMADAAE